MTAGTPITMSSTAAVAPPGSAAAAAASPVGTSGGGAAEGVASAAPSAALLSLTDEGLLKRMRANDPAAADALVGRYAEPLLRYLQRLVGEEQAEELHQQTWLSVLGNLDQFKPSAGGGAAGGSPFKAWLFRIATNKANDLWRSRGRERVAKEGLRLVIEATAAPAWARAERADAERKLIHAVARLPETQRQVLALRYYSDMKFVDIAKLLGCPLNTALGRVHKALGKLRQLMEE